MALKTNAGISAMLILSSGLAVFAIMEQRFFMLGDSAFSADGVYKNVVVTSKVNCVRQCLLDQPTCVGFNLHRLNETWKCEFVDSYKEEGQLTYKNQSSYHRKGVRIPKLFAETWSC